SPVMIVMTTIIMMAGRISFSIVLSSREADGGDNHVDRLDADERHDDAAETVDKKIASQDARRADRAVTDTFERQRDQSDNNERVEDDRRQNGGLRPREPHDVECLE